MACFFLISIYFSSIYLFSTYKINITDYVSVFDIPIQLEAETHQTWTEDDDDEEEEKGRK